MKGQRAVGKRRIFGTERSTNVQSKYATDKSLSKPAVSVLQKPKRPAEEIQTTNCADAKIEPVINVMNDKSPVERKPRTQKKLNALLLEEKLVTDKVKESEDFQEKRSDSPVAQTPVATPGAKSEQKTQISATPYYTAQKIIHCRFDKLETSSYWVGQIKLAESVGKHFVAAAFFKLAFDSMAEPIRNLRIELKKYMSRHAHVSHQLEWREVCGIYGLQKAENAKNETASNMVKNGVSSEVDEEQDDKQAPSERC